MGNESFETCEDGLFCRTPWSRYTSKKTYLMRPHLVHLNNKYIFKPFPETFLLNYIHIIRMNIFKPIPIDHGKNEILYHNAMFDIIINEILTYQVECNIQVVTYCDKLWHGLSVVYGLPYLSWSYLGHNFKYKMYSSKFNRYTFS